MEYSNGIIYLSPTVNCEYGRIPQKECEMLRRRGEPDLEELRRRAAQFKKKKRISKRRAILNLLRRIAEEDALDGNSNEDGEGVTERKGSRV